MTQEQIAHLLRREGGTEAARRLQDDGFIRYSRGVIQVLDRKGLLTRSCECYGLVQRLYERLLSFRGRQMTAQASAPWRICRSASCERPTKVSSHCSLTRSISPERRKASVSQPSGNSSPRSTDSM